MSLSGLAAEPSATPKPNQTAAKPEIILIIDDLGDTYKYGQQTLNLPVAANLAFLPNTPYSQKLATLAPLRGHSVMLHLPMEPVGRTDLLGPEALRISHNRQQITELMQQNLAQFPQAVGFNNHMGSRLTASAEHMQWVMQLAAEKSLIFVDSRTSSDSVALTAAHRAGVATLDRDVFLDPADGSRSVVQQLMRAFELADKHGRVVIIGHPHKRTLDILHLMLPYYREKYQWLTLEQLLPSSKPSAERLATLAQKSAQQGE